jgi:hypothetical protein
MYVIGEQAGEEEVWFWIPIIYLCPHYVFENFGQKTKGPR